MPYPRSLIALAALIGLAIAIGVPVALGQGVSLSERQREVDSRISDLRDQIDQAKREVGVLTSEIDAATAKINVLAADIDVLNGKIAKLEAELTVHRGRLSELKDLHRYQTDRLKQLRSQQREAQLRLEDRLVDLYQTDPPDLVEIVLGARSLNELIEQIELFKEIGRQDAKIAEQIKTIKVEMRGSRQKTARTKTKVAEATAALAGKSAKRQKARDELLARQRELLDARSSKERLLASVHAEREEAEEDLEEMLAASAEIAAKIKAAQAAAAAQTSGQVVGGSGSVSAAGLIWPAHGYLTSRFGPRWGRMHEGVDIAAGSGSPIYAAASGTVIFTGWLGGYGNLVIIDHGGGLATAYGHMSAIYVAPGEIGQGQVLGAMGSTGFSTGPHVHFELRVNGVPVDPLGYL